MPNGLTDNGASGEYVHVSGLCLDRLCGYRGCRSSDHHARWRRIGGRETDHGKYLATEECNAVGAGQFCPADPTNYWPTKTQFYAKNGSIKVDFTANPNHCSDMIAHVFINGKQWGSNIVHPGQSDGGYEIPIDRAGLQQIAIQAEGVPGGCNTGAVSAWGGTLRIWQLT